MPRLGIGGRDHDDDIAAAIVVMGRTQHTNDILPRVQAEVEKLNSDGSLLLGVKIVAYYDRSSLVGVTTHTFTVTPVLAALLLPKHIEEVETTIVRALRKSYTPVLRWALGNVRVAVLVGCVFLGLSVAAASRLGSEFLPALEEGNFWIRAAMPSTMSLDAGTTATRKMREILLRHPSPLRSAAG